MAGKISTTYTPYPHKIWCCIEKASRLLAIGDITIRPIDSKVKASPNVAPKDRLLGDTAVKYMYIQPIAISVRQTFDFERNGLCTISKLRHTTSR